MDRHFYIDRLRVVLTVLVIFHHTAITYGASGSWFYRELAAESSITSRALTLFCAVNQSFFMGAFFLLAGLYVPQSFHRKGVARFVKDRLVRLGIPVLVFGGILGPLTVGLARLGNSPRDTAIALNLPLWVLGPLWFPWALLLFSLGYALFRKISRETPVCPNQALPKHIAWGLAALCVGAVSLAIRQSTPVGDSVIGLQLGYFASYVFLFGLGCTASLHGWLERLSWSHARWWLFASFALIPVLPAALQIADQVAPGAQNFAGGLNISSVVYAMWEPFVAWGVIAALVVVFRQYLNAPNERWDRWGKQAYGAFFVHTPLTVAFAIPLSGLDTHAAIKFCIVSLCAVATSFFVSGLLLRSTLIRRVL